MSDTRWIVIPNWEIYQHYKDRDPAWIKDHLAQLHKDEYRALTFAQRGLLEDLRKEYASSHWALRDDTASLTRRLGQRVVRAQLDALNHAGFIEYSASKPLAPRYHAASPRALARIREEKEVLRTSFSSSEGASKTPAKKGGQASAPDDNPETVHAALLTAAREFAQGYTTGSSELFDEQLDRLEQEHHGRLGFLERDELWETAYAAITRARLVR